MLLDSMGKQNLYLILHSTRYEKCSSACLSLQKNHESYLNFQIHPRYSISNKQNRSSIQASLLDSMFTIMRTTVTDRSCEVIGAVYYYFFFRSKSNIKMLTQPHCCPAQLIFFMFYEIDFIQNREKSEFLPLILCNIL